MFGLFRKICGWKQPDEEEGQIKPVPHDRSMTFIVKLDSLEVGTLHSEGGEWTFKYSERYRNQSRFAPIVDFPALDREYRRAELWPFFALRIPSLNQPAVQAYLQRHPGVSLNEGDLLRAFGDRSIANPFRVIAVDSVRPEPALA
jgi:HipA-like protein